MKILIVDDEPEILAIVAKWLAKKGHEALTTSDGQRALDLVESGEFNLVLLDLIMPHASGLNLIARIHERRPFLPIVVMSVIEDTRIAVLAAKEGIEGYITKPIEFEKLDSILQRLQP